MSAKTLRQTFYLFLAAALLGVALHTRTREANAMPMFARRYGVPCSTCHTSPPRLNEVGYKFRAAGFRMPEEVGKIPEELSKVKILNHIGFRLQPRLDVLRSESGGVSETHSKGTLFAAEAYIWYGPINRYFGSNLKVTIYPDEGFETEDEERVEGNIRFTYGNQDGWLDLRAGVPHPMEGFGGSEYYVIANSRPFIQELRSAFFNQNTFFGPITYHQAGLTMAYHHKKTTIRGVITPGIRLKIDEKTDTLQAFGRKEPFTHAIPQHNEGGPDVQLFFNQILHPNGGNVSVYFYDGRSHLPRLDMANPMNHPTTPEFTPQMAGLFASNGIRPLATAGLSSEALPHTDALTREEEANALAQIPWFKNHFNRLAFYTGYPIKRLSLLFGIQGGRDAIGSGGHFTSLGHFTEANVKLFNDISVIGARYDWFDPARNLDQNEMKGFTAYMNLWLHSELRVTPEYQHLVFNRGVGQNKLTQDRFQIRLYWIR